MHDEVSGILAILLHALQHMRMERVQEIAVAEYEYVVGFFHKGPNWTATQTEETRCIQAGHIANFEKLADAGKLIVAGPFGDDGELAAC